MSARDELQAQRDARAQGLARAEQYSAEATDPILRRRWSKTVTELSVEVGELDSTIARLGRASNPGGTQ